ncbi:hypothetical protein [Rheinheimera maricola]|uniref:Uncharacterized protein n=1 Tax=Rheinheimera maricola TaxID=2793282 RepID=A0ABS7X5H9_9GAMM|nr:hypothetical protein [Rheinheimera maricola]MBZ9610803.1 hypothetical protein [Rheinheimera maricola]
MEKINFVVLPGQRLDHNNERVTAGGSVLLTEQEAAPLLTSHVIALPADAQQKLLASGEGDATAELEELLQLKQQQLEELSGFVGTLHEQIATLQKDVEAREEAMAALEAARLQAEEAAKAAAEAQIAAEAEVTRVSAELKAATAKAPAKTDSKPK